MSEIFWKYIRHCGNENLVSKHFFGGRKTFIETEKFSKLHMSSKSMLHTLKRKKFFVRKYLEAIPNFE